MTDKEKIKAEVERLKKEISIGLSAYDAGEENGKWELCEKILSFINSLPEEPIREDLRVVAMMHFKDVMEYEVKTGLRMANMTSFKAGAQWQKEHLWKPADGDDLPEYDREVIAILDYDFGHYKVVYAHRPNPDGWNGTNKDTGEKEYFEPVIYDKGGWNQPHVLYWLDIKLPYEENKIDKVKNDNNLI